jgi:hypothetical protein
MTPLDKILKRALRIDGRDYVVTLSPESLKITGKGKWLGIELKWADITSGESALAIALHASVGRFAGQERPAVPRVARNAAPKSKGKKKRPR